MDEQGTVRYIVYYNQIRLIIGIHSITSWLYISIFSVKDGVFRKYEGSRSLKGLMDFISDQKWREIEPIPWWKSPSSHL